MTTTTTFADIHPHIIKTHILPRLDGPSLSTVATLSSDLHTLCSDHNLWSNVSSRTWPSIAHHPRLHALISTFTGGHRSFFKDSYPSLITDLNHRSCCRSRSNPQPPPPPPPDCSFCYLDTSTHPWPSELISAVDIRYQSDVVYSTVEFTGTTSADFMSSELLITLNGDATKGISRCIELEVDALAGVDESTLSHLKDSVTLTWIVIDPILKRAGNLSSMKPIRVKKDWMTNETLVQYVTVLGGGGSVDDMVQCRIQVVLGVGEGGVGLEVKEVVMKMVDLDGGGLKGGEFVGVLQRAIVGERKVVVDDEERWRSRRRLKEMRRTRKEMVKKEEERRETDIVFNYVGIFVSFCFSLYFLRLMLE